MTVDNFKRTDKIPMNDIFCRGCGSKLGKVVDHRYVNLDGYDRKCMVDLVIGTVTVKCKCGVGRVIRRRGDDDLKLGDVDVRDQENDGCSDSDIGKPEGAYEGSN